MDALLQFDAWKKGFKSDAIIGSMLISTYNKYDDIVEVEIVFAALLEHDTVAWNVMLSGYVKHHQEHNAFKLYAQMQEESIPEMSGHLWPVFKHVPALHRRKNQPD